MDVEHRLRLSLYFVRASARGVDVLIRLRVPLAGVFLRSAASAGQTLARRHGTPRVAQIRPTSNRTRLKLAHHRSLGQARLRRAQVKFCCWPLAVEFVYGLCLLFDIVHKHNMRGEASPTHFQAKVHGVIVVGCVYFVYISCVRGVHDLLPVLCDSCLAAVLLCFFFAGAVDLSVDVGPSQ